MISLIGVKQFTCDCTDVARCFHARHADSMAKAAKAYHFKDKQKLWLLILTAHRKTALRYKTPGSHLLNINYHFYEH